MWSRSLPTQSSNPSTPNTGRSPGSDAERDVGTAVYGEGRSRPAQPHSRPSTAAGENAPRQNIPLDWVRGVERLHRLPAHVGVPQYRWGVFLNDFDQFIHGRGGWAERAADLIWDTLALFGCHPTRPQDHLNGAGLLWRLSGGRIIAMYTNWAVIEINGVQHIVHRGVPRRPTSCCRGGDGHPERQLGWPEFTTWKGNIDIVRREGRRGQWSIVCRPRQRREAPLAVIGSVLARPAVAFRPPSHSSKGLSPVVP
jgi:hypothetical protein